MYHFAYITLSTFQGSFYNNGWIDRPIINITLSGVLPQLIQQRTEKSTYRLTPIKYSHVVYDNISQRIQDEAHCAGPETD
jgi:hypothetical protein